MRILIILLLISLTLNSQTFTEKNFNVHIFNKKLYQKINDYRKKNNIDTLIYSNVSEELVSKINVNKMVEKSLCYHPDVNFYDGREIGESLFIEYYKKLNLKREYPEFDSVWYAEISAFTSKTFNNYDEMAEYFLNGWINSPKHKEILNTNFKLSHSGICSTYVKKSKEGYYASFNFMGMTVITNN
jgi:uncharacterized protein YkwD